MTALPDLPAGGVSLPGGADFGGQCLGCDGVVAEHSGDDGCGRFAEEFDVHMGAELVGEGAQP